MDVPRAAQALAPRAWQPQGVGSEAYLSGTSQGEPVLSLSKEHPRTPGRTTISVVAASDSWNIRASGLVRGNSSASQESGGWSSAIRGILAYFPGLHLDLGNRNAGRGGCE